MDRIPSWHEDTVEGFFVVEDMDDDRGGTYPKFLGILVPSFNNMFFATDDWAMQFNYREHEQGKGIKLASSVEVRLDIVFKIINMHCFKKDVKNWWEQMSEFIAEHA